MPTKRKKITHQIQRRITDAAIEAFRAGDWHTLHRELGLRPWHTSPLNAGPHGYKGSPDYELMRELRLELLAAAGLEESDV